MGGTLVFRGTRVPAQTLLDYFDDDFSLDEFTTCSPPCSATTRWSFFGWRAALPMTIILDENLPKPLKGIFPDHSVTTVQEQGPAGTVNGALLARLEGVFDVFITADKNLRYQQDLRRRALAIIELPTNRLPLLRPLFPRVTAAVDAMRPGDYVQLTF